MTKLLTIILLVCATTLALASSRSAPPYDQPINSECPIGKEAINGETLAGYGGHKIGFCCPGCDAKFAAWSTAEKDAFVENSLAGQDEGDEEASDKETTAAPNEPYTLATCPVSGEELGSMGEPIVLETDGSEVKLCCKGCLKKFEADNAKYMEVVSDGIAAQQLSYYPLKTCVVSGEPLSEDGKDIAVDVVVGNRLFRVCCKSCVKTVREDAGKYLATLNAAVIKSQAEHYPLSSCLVRDKSKLGSMGEPVQRIVGNRLVQFCCGGCEPKFNAEPSKFLAVLDAAWAKRRSEQASKEEASEHKHGEKGHEEGGGR